MNKLFRIGIAGFQLQSRIAITVIAGRFSESYIECFGMHNSVTPVAKMLQVSRQTVYKWLRICRENYVEGKKIDINTYMKKRGRPGGSAVRGGGRTLGPLIRLPGVGPARTVPRKPRG